MYRTRDKLPPLGQRRGLGLDIDMIGARGDHLGSTRSETREMRSSNNQEMERADMTMDNWTQELCYMSAVHLDLKHQTLSMMHGIIIPKMKEQNGGTQSPKNSIVWKKIESGKKQE